MRCYRTAYPPEFLRRTADLVRSGADHTVDFHLGDRPSGMPASALTGRQGLSGSAVTPVISSR
jgi:hypothetical protein